MFFSINRGLLSFTQKYNRNIPTSLNYTGLSGTPMSTNNLGRVKVLMVIGGPPIDPDDPDTSPQYYDMIWKRCNSTSTYNDENYIDVRHNYNVGDIINFTVFSIYNGFHNITGSVIQTTDTTFTTRSIYFGSPPAVYNCTTVTRARIRV